jgi:hypothetical protein
MTRRKRSTFLKDRRVAVPGAKETPGYRSWSHMRDRCQNPNDASYYKYGERGITVCERWDDLTNFLADMGKPPPGMSLDRIDPDGNYEPSVRRDLPNLVAREPALNGTPCKSAITV